LSGKRLSGKVTVRETTAHRFDKSYQQLSKLVHVCQNYSLPKLARF